MFLIQNGSTWLHFEGVFQMCDIFLNGQVDLIAYAHGLHVWSFVNLMILGFDFQFLKRHRAGYLGFDVQLDNLNEGLLKFGRGADGVPTAANTNVLAVRVDARWVIQPESESLFVLAVFFA